MFRALLSSRSTRRHLRRAAHAAARPPLRCAAAGMLAFACANAAAHDTWLEQRGGSALGRVELALTTGELFPIAETPVAADALAGLGCTARDGRPVPLHAGTIDGPALRLHAQAPPGTALHGCGVQTITFELALAAHLVPLYLREIAAPEAVRAAWAEQQRRGLPWTERYSKHARISFEGATSRASAPGSVPPLALDIEIENDEPPRAGQALTFRAWRDGRPLPGLAVELRGEASRFGLWRRTDAEGRASVTVPLPGRWVLRATDLRPVPEEQVAPGGARWESRFATHSFAAGAAAPQPLKISSANARSANQASASSAISNEPPTSTVRR